MKFCYAFRRGTFYPFIAGQGWNIPAGETREKYLGRVKSIGFDGIELGFESFGGFDASEQEAKELQKELADAGVPCVAIRAGGGLSQPNVASNNRNRLEKAVEVAGWIGAEIVNTALGTPPRDGTVDTGPNGEPSSHGSSAQATRAKAVHGRPSAMEYISEVKGVSCPCSSTATRAGAACKNASGSDVGSM